MREIYDHDGGSMAVKKTHKALAQHPQERTRLCITLTMPPPYMYADVIQTTIALIDDILNHLSSAPGPLKISYARADAIARFSARLLYGATINSVAAWTPQR